MEHSPATQYADDRNLRARQALWATSRRERPFDLYPWVLELAGVARGGVSSVLDVGCGNGGYEHTLAATGHRGRRVALDLSVGMLRTVADAERAQADVQALPFVDEAFDVALAPHMLYHVDDVALAAGELRRVLRDGGVLVAVTNSVDNLGELRDLVEDAVRTIGGKPWQMVRPADERFNMESGAAPLSTAFDAVEAVWCPRNDLFVEDADALADYVASTADHYEPEAGVSWSDVVEHVRLAAAARIATDGALRCNTSAGAFVCR
jgi:SAM-dependent methyltransferase